MDPRFFPSLATALPAALLVVAAALPARADPLRVESSGVFTQETVATPFSAPGATWSMSFIVDQHPMPITDDAQTQPGLFVSVPFSDFQMRVDGVEVAPATGVVLFSGPNGGGMDVIFGGIGADGLYDALGTYGTGYYSGSELAPTIEPGSYLTAYPADPVPPGYTGIYVSSAGNIYWQPATLVTISAVPLPGSAAMMLAGLAALALRPGRAMVCR